MDSAPAQSADIALPAIDTETVESNHAHCLAELWKEAGADSLGLTSGEFAAHLVAIGTKCNYGLPPGVAAGHAQIESFFRGPHLQDLALALACALGRDVAWQEFLNRYRGPLTRTATAITGSASSGEELADSLYSEMFGMTEREGQRQSPLAGYSGRGSLIGFLRASLAQRNVDRHRRTRRETPLESSDAPAPAQPAAPASDLLLRMEAALRQTLAGLDPDERFLLSAWFLDQRTLLEISRVVRVHEATVSRRIQRLTARLHDDLLKHLQSSGMSGAAAQDALGVEPGDLDINLRKLLQYSQSAAFSERGTPPGRMPAQTVSSDSIERS